MPDLAAIAHRVVLAIGDAEQHGAQMAAEVLRRDVADLERLAHLGTKRRCSDCEYSPTTAPPSDPHAS